MMRLHLAKSPSLHLYSIRPLRSHLIIVVVIFLSLLNIHLKSINASLEEVEEERRKK